MLLICYNNNITVFLTKKRTRNRKITEGMLGETEKVDGVTAGMLSNTQDIYGRRKPVYNFLSINSKD